MNWINNFLNRINTYTLLLYYLRVLIAAGTILSFFNVLPYTWWHILADMTIILVVCWAANGILGYIFKVKPNFESQFISGEIMTMIIGPVNPVDSWQFLILVSVVAMASKYILAINKRHLFNPTAFAFVVSALAIQQSASWWVGSIYLLPIVLIGGFLLVKKLRWFHLVFSFLITYTVLLVVRDLEAGVSLAQSITTLKITFGYTSILFFATVMLTEPLTAPSRIHNRIIYGATVAIVMVATQAYFPQIYYNLELSLIVGNLIAFAMSPNPKILLRLKEKLYFARNSLYLEFTPEKPIKFLPGQYMQFILAHDKPDSRGTRRYFSIASSPTEKTIILATKLAEKGSSFKDRLKNMNKDETLLAAALDGDFVLPDNSKRGLVFIAGGVGITPFRSMIKYLTDTGKKTDVTLLYQNKDPEDIGFTELFDEAEEKIGLKTVYLLTGKIPANWPGKKGLLTPQILREEIPDYMDKIFYVSGPDPMVRAYVQLLKDLGVRGLRIKTDFFPGYE